MAEHSVEELKKNGGNWLGAARRWLQHNVVGGDQLTWSSYENVNLTVNKIEDLAAHVALAVYEDMEKKGENRTTKY